MYMHIMCACLDIVSASLQCTLHIHILVLDQVTKDSLGKVAEMQNRLTEAHSRFSESSKRVQQVESERRKLEYSLQQAKVCVHNTFCM